MSRIAFNRLYLNSEQKSWEKGSAAPNTNNVCTLSRNEARAEKPVVHTPRRTLAQRCRWAACRVAPRWKRVIIPIGTETREGERNERHPRRGRHRRGAAARSRPGRPLPLHAGGLPVHDDLRPGRGVHLRHQPGGAPPPRPRRAEGLPRGQEVACAEARPAELPVQGRGPPGPAVRLTDGTPHAAAPLRQAVQPRRGGREARRPEAKAQGLAHHRLRAHHPHPRGAPPPLRREEEAHPRGVRPQQEGRPQRAGPRLRGGEERGPRPRARGAGRGLSRRRRLGGVALRGVRGEVRRAPGRGDLPRVDRQREALPEVRQGDDRVDPPEGARRRGRRALRASGAPPVRGVGAREEEARGGEQGEAAARGEAQEEGPLLARARRRAGDAVQGAQVRARGPGRRRRPRARRAQRRQEALPLQELQEGPTPHRPADGGRGGDVPRGGVVPPPRHDQGGRARPVLHGHAPGGDARPARRGIRPRRGGGRRAGADRGGPARREDRRLHQVGQLDAHGPARPVHGVGRGGVDRGEEARPRRDGARPQELDAASGRDGQPLELQLVQEEMERVRPESGVRRHAALRPPTHVRDHQPRPGREHKDGVGTSRARRRVLHARPVRRVHPSHHEGARGPVRRQARPGARERQGKAWT